MLGPDEMMLFKGGGGGQDQEGLQACGGHGEVLEGHVGREEEELGRCGVVVVDEDRVEVGAGLVVEDDPWLTYDCVAGC